MDAFSTAVVPPHVAALVPVDVLARTADHQHLVDLLAQLGRLADRLVDGGLQRRRRAAAVPAVGRDDDLGLAVGDPVGERVGREPAEDHGVGGADPRTGEHRHHGLGDHRQVDRHPVTGLHAELDERVGRLADLVLEVGVGELAGVVLGLADPVDRDLVTLAGLDVPVDAVVRRVDASAHEPLGEGRVVPVEDAVPLLVPVEALGLLGPERLAVGVRPVVRLGLHVRVVRELGRRLEATRLGAQVGEGLVTHDSEPTRHARAATTPVWARGAVRSVAGDERSGRRGPPTLTG